MSKGHSINGRGRAKGRRKFLKNMMLGGGAAAVALMTSREAVAQPQPGPDTAKQPASKGYHVTPHIEHYYRTAGL